MQQNKKGLIIFFGESFRGNTQNDLDQIVLNQLISVQTHLFFLENIKKKFNLELDNILLSRLQPDSLSNEFFLILNEIYNFKFYKFCNNPRELGVTNFLRWVEDNIISIFKSENIYNYEFVFLIRIDAALDKFFLNYFNPFEDKVKYMFPLSYIGYSQSPNKPNKINASRLFYKSLQQDEDFIKYGSTVINKENIYCADTHIFWPKKLFNNIKLISTGNGENMINHHSGFRKTEKYLGSDNVEYYINTLHNVQTGISWNPFFWFPHKPLSKFNTRLKIKKESKFMFLEKIKDFEIYPYNIESINKQREKITLETKHSNLFSNTIKRLKMIL